MIEISTLGGVSGDEDGRELRKSDFRGMMDRTTSVGRQNESLYVCVVINLERWLD